MTATELVFLDTNVLIYARDARNVEKMHRAQEWILGLSARETVHVNLQVLNELTRWILRNEPHRSMHEVREEIAALRVWGDRPLADEETDLAWAARKALGYQWFDCLLLAAAVLQGCRYFLTEDMADGAKFETLTLINPFRASPDELLAPN